MTFARVNPAGWTQNVDPITKPQIDQLDINVSRSLDGTAGGPYTPAASLSIGGAGIEFTDVNHEVASGALITVKSGGEIAAESGGQIRIESGGKLRFEGPSSKLDGEVRAGDTNPLDIVSGQMRFTGANLECRATVLFTAASTFTCDGSAFFNDTCEFDSGVDFNANVQIDGDLGCAGDVSLTAGTLFSLVGTVLAGPVTLDDPMTLTGNGHIRSRVTLGGDVNATYSVSTTDIVWVNSGVITAARTYLVDDTGAGQGSRMKFMVLGSAFTITIRRASDNSLIGTIIRNAPGDVFSLDIFWLTSSGRWEILGYDTN
jgi:hypothetical protein